jgi:hypothetical protein
MSFGIVDVKIIGEEDTGTGAIPELTTKPTWIIDPIDGTVSFSSCHTIYTHHQLMLNAIFKRPILPRDYPYPVSA